VGPELRPPTVSRSALRDRPPPVYPTTHVVLATVLGGAFAGSLLVAMTAVRVERLSPAAGGALGALGLGLAMAMGLVGDALALPYGVTPVVAAAGIGAGHQLWLALRVAAAVDDGAPEGSVVGLGTTVLVGAAQSMAWAAIT